MKSSAVRLFCLSFLLLTLFAVGAYADTINLGTAGSYAVLAGSTVTNTGPTVLNGDLGLSPGSSVTGFFPQGPGIVNGTRNVDNGAAVQAQNDLITAYNQAAGKSGAHSLPGTVGNRTLTPGVYKFSSSAKLTGHLILRGTPNALFVFQIGSTLTTASASSVIFINSLTNKPMQDPNIFWQVTSSATLDTGTKFEGNILALSSITLNTGATIKCGSALARNGAVTLDTNVITNCGAIPPVPEPGTMGLLGTGLVILVGAARRKMRI